MSVRCVQRDISYQYTNTTDLFFELLRGTESWTAKVQFIAAVIMSY